MCICRHPCTGWFHIIYIGYHTFELQSHSIWFFSCDGQHNKSVCKLQRRWAFKQTRAEWVEQRCSHLIWLVIYTWHLWIGLPTHGATHVALPKHTVFCCSKDIYEIRFVVFNINVNIFTQVVCQPVGLNILSDFLRWSCVHCLSGYAQALMLMPPAPYI